MDFLDDPEEMKTEERLAEVAAILATGYLRLKSHPLTENPLDSLATPMPLSDQGWTDREPVPAEVTP